MYKRRKRPHLASKGGAQIQTSVTQEDKPSSPSAVEKADNDLCSLEPSTLPPVEIGLGPSSTFVEDKRHEQQEDSLPSEPRYFYPFPPVKPFSYDTTPFKAKMKHTYRVQSEKSTSSNLETPNYEQKVIPSVNVIRKRNYQYAYPPTFSSGNSKAITSSTVAEKIQDADWTEKPTASQPSDKKPSRSSTIPEKEGISPARLEVATIPAGVIEDAIKRLKIADVQAAHSSSSTDPTVTRAVADLATSVDNPDVDAGSDPAPNDTPSPDDIFYVPSEQPERTPEAETENVCKLEEEDFEYYYPRLISHTYAEYDDKEWVDVMASKDWEDHESYA
ncbi:uncharacterized protein N7511_000199 [Penicillium nucicola]|uniref:uncharacterized protein n=1 Tax=Penicillium nucicola TaxID=1850975 RepID=UPI002545B291|nr:uncharacterized protein N7511_000199 [Penicillium nucicola]KAJ5775188.1 hypothetical protein N7511_000199 [Penicillium nucicola]